MTLDADARQAALWAEAEIRRVLLRYARGVDRLDLDLVRSCYHPDATDSHGSFAGTVDEFLVWVERVLRRYDLTMHFLGNPLVELEWPARTASATGVATGGRSPSAAAVETYGVALHHTAGGPPERNLVTGFRFLDRFEFRAGEWRIARRLAVTEWSRVLRDDDWWPIPDGMVRLGVTAPTPCTRWMHGDARMVSRLGRGGLRGGVTAHPLDDTHRATLLAAAVETVGRALVDGTRVLPEPGDEPALAQAAASFVTLERGEALLGCIGSLEATEPLLVNVARNAWNAAFADPRLPSVTRSDYAVMSVKVSVLSPLTPLRARSWRDVARLVRPGVDGVLVEAGGRRATLLPSVWEKLPDPEDFLDVLWHKAGLRPRDWLPRTTVRRYTVEELVDPGPRALPPA